MTPRTVTWLPGLFHMTVMSKAVSSLALSASGRSRTRASQNAVKTSTQACAAACKVAIQGDQAERVADRIAVDAEA